MSPLFVWVSAAYFWREERFRFVETFQRWCVDAVLRLLGVFHDVLYGDVAPVRPGSTLGVVSVRLSRSLFVPGRHLEKGGRLPSPPLLAPTPGWPPRGGLVSAPQLPTPGWPLWSLPPSCSPIVRVHVFATSSVPIARSGVLVVRHHLE